jgi:hypothetical protein
VSVVIEILQVKPRSRAMEVVPAFDRKFYGFFQR